MRKLIRPILNLIQGRPLLAIFEINMQCNSSCGYCDLPLNKGRYEMSRQEIRDVFSRLYDDGLRYVFIQGGEPTLRKDLIEVLGDLHILGFQLSLITNGTRLSTDFIKRLQTLPVSISVSLDTLDRQRYKEIRGADQLALTVNGIQNLRGYPHPKYITCIISEKNREDVPALVDYAIEQGFIPVLGAYHWNIDRYGKVDPALQYKNTEAIKVFDEVLRSKRVPRGYFRNYLQDNIRWLAGKKLARCDAGRYSIAIDPAGNVAPCLALNHAGNLREKDLKDIIGNMDRRYIKQCSDRSSCNMMCSRVVGSSLRHPLSALLTPDRLTGSTLLSDAHTQN